MVNILGVALNAPGDKKASEDVAVFSPAHNVDLNKSGLIMCRKISGGCDAASAYKPAGSGFEALQNLAYNEAKNAGSDIALGFFKNDNLKFFNEVNRIKFDRKGTKEQVSEYIDNQFKGLIAKNPTDNVFQICEKFERIVLGL